MTPMSHRPGGTNVLSEVVEDPAITTNEARPRYGPPTDTPAPNGETMARSNRLIALGAAVLVVGMGLTALALQAAGADTGPAPAVAAPETPTTDTVPDDPAVPASAAPEARAPEILDIPEGTEAVAFQLPFDAGVGAYPAPGDHVNVYGVYGTDVTDGSVETQDPGNDSPSVRLTLHDVEVLAVIGASPVTGGSPTFVFALSSRDVERAVLLHNAESAWLSLVPEGTSSATTSGVDLEGLLP